MHHVTIAFRGKERTVEVDPHTTTLGDLSSSMQAVLPGLAPNTLKLLVPKPRAQSLQLEQQPHVLLSDAGVQPGTRLMLLGSFTSELADLEASAAAEAALRLPSFEHEARLAQRRRGAGGSSSSAPPSSRHCFGSFQVLPLPPGAPSSLPPPSSALALLHRLACDPAIAAVMATHGWKVGLLSEMPPEGKVGVSAVCVLGYNVNRGQEVSLRLRTDDWRGFRKYLRIRETLVHELAHMVFDEHDSNFKALNSQLLKEVAGHEAAAAGGRTLAGAGIFNSSNWLGDDEPAGEGAAAAATAQRGRTLGVRAAGSASGGGDSNQLGVREAAATAALDRWQLNQQQQQQQQQPTKAAGAAPHSPGTPAAAAAGVEAQEREGTPETAAAAAAAAAAAVASAAERGSPVSAQQLDRVMSDASDAAVFPAIPAAANASAVPPGWCSDGDDDALTDDPATAAAEEEMRRLGSRDDVVMANGEEQQQQQQQHEGPNKQQQQQQGANQEQQEQQQQAARPADAQCNAQPDPNLLQQPRGCDPMSVVHEQHVPDSSSGSAVKDPPAASPATAVFAGNGSGAAAALGAAAAQAAPAAAPAGSTGTANNPAAATSDASVDAADAVDAASVGSAGGTGGDDVVLQKLIEAQSLVQQLTTQAGSSGSRNPSGSSDSSGSLGGQQQQQLQALQAVEGVLASVAEHPHDPKYRRLRCSNAAFHRKVGQFPAARQLLLLAGFAERQLVWQQQQAGVVQPGSSGAAGVAEPVLVYVRDDPGLLWLVLSTVRDELQRLQE